MRIEIMQLKIPYFPLKMLIEIYTNVRNIMIKNPTNYAPIFLHDIFCFYLYKLSDESIDWSLFFPFKHGIHDLWFFFLPNILETLSVLIDVSR